jgi:hypothetical protein
MSLKDARRPSLREKLEAKEVKEEEEKKVAKIKSPKKK